jgi:hypothetical protein
MAARWRAMWDGVEIPVAIAPKEDRLGQEILNRKTRSVKLNRTVIVASKLSNRQQVMSKLRSDKNIMKLEGTIS